MNEISVIIPAFNEEQSISKTISDVKKGLSDFSGYYEIIVVDDGSTDKTFQIANESTILVIKHDRNRGYGAAIKTGIKHSKYQNIAITDADGTYPNKRMKELITILFEEKIDMVVGARIGQNVNIHMLRKPAKWVIQKLANYLTDTKIPDKNSGMRVITKDALNKYLNILPNGFSFTTTITLAMLSNGYLVRYIPIDYYKREGKSKIKPIYDTLNFIQLIIRTVMYFNPLKVFVPLSLFLVLLAFLVLLGSWIFTGKAMDVTFGVILMTSVMVLVIGMLADLIDKRIQ